MRRIVGLLKEAGATEVHLRIACPPVVYPCFYGVDTPGQSELSACHLTKDELQRQFLRIHWNFCPSKVLKLPWLV